MKIQGKTTFPPRKAQVPAKTHVVVIAGYVDQGTQPGFSAEDDPEQRISIIYEFPSILVKTKDEQMMPAWLFQDYSTRMGSAQKPSNLRKVFEAAFNEPVDEDREYDPADLVGRALQVKVSHNTRPTGDVWEKVGEVLALPDGFQAPKLTARPLVHDLYNEDGSLCEPDPRLGKFRIEKIKKSFEWTGRKGGAAPASDDDVDSTPF